MKKLLVVLFLIALGGGLWYFSSRRWRKWVISGIALILAVGLLLSSSSTALLDQAFLSFLPSDQGEPVEAIVVLGRGLEFGEQRVTTASELWQSKRAPLIFTSGRRDAPDMVNRLKGMDIPSFALSGENCSTTTSENAFYTLSFLKTRGIRHILLVTDTPHLLRSVLTFRSFDFKVVPHASSLPSNLSTITHLKISIREGLGLIGYWVKGRFQPQLKAEVNKKLESMSMTQTQMCRVEG